MTRHLAIENTETTQSENQAWAYRTALRRERAAATGAGYLLVFNQIVRVHRGRGTVKGPIDQASYSRPSPAGTRIGNSAGLSIFACSLTSLTETSGSKAQSAELHT